MSKQPACRYCGRPIDPEDFSSTYELRKGFCLPCRVRQKKYMQSLDKEMAALVPKLTAGRRKARKESWKLAEKARNKGWVVPKATKESDER